MNLLRYASLPALGSLALALLCGTAAAQTLTITTWTATSPGFQEWWPKVESAFEAAHPGADLVIENIAFADYMRTLTTRFVAGSPPQIVHVPLPTINLPALADAGFLKPVDDRIEGTEYATDWPAAQSAMEWKGKTYGLLTVQYGFNFFYNQKLLDDAGIKLPTTPEELKAAAAALTKDGKYGFAVTDDNTVNFMRDALEFVTGMEGEWVKDGAWNWTDPKVVAAIELWRDIAANYAPKGTDIAAKRQAFYDGNVAMMIENPSVWPNVAAAAKPELLDSLHLGAMPFPRVPGDVSQGYAIPEGADQATADLAWSLIELVASPELMRSYVELVKTPVARTASNEPLLAKPDDARIAEAGAQAVPIIPNDYFGVRMKYADFSAEVTNALRSILQGTSVPDAMAALQSQLTAKGITPLG
jgi:multiple sugar transport system substrate-binding protein